MEKNTYYYDEIVRWIEEDKITIWDLALRLDLSISSTQPLDTLLKMICNNNILKADRLKKQLKENSKNYAKENKSNKKLNYTTLVELANNGFGSTEIMKLFGYIDYQQYTNATTKIINNENIKRSIIKELKLKIKHNRKNKEIEILPNKDNSSIPNIPNTETSNNSVSIQNVEKVNENLAPCEVISSIKGFDSQKIIMYTYEYLKDEDFGMELLNFEEEKIILSVTLNKFISDVTIPDAKKIALSNAINDPKINLRVLMAMSNYEKKNITTQNLAYENDLIISQALMLAGYTDKEIYIASKSHLTSLNVMSLGFGIRLSKRLLINEFCDIQDEDSLTYFDYKNPNIDLSTLQNKKAYVLDTCVLIGSTDKIMDDSIRITRTRIRNSILTNKEEKLLFYPVLNELKTYEVFSSTIHAAKLNPSIKLILDMPLFYEYSDISILNLSMYFKRKYNMDVTLLTHDFKLYTEALQYNFKAVFCNNEQWLTKFKSDNKICYSLKIREKEAEEYISDNNIYKTHPFSKVKNAFVLLSNNSFEKVMDKNRKVLPLMGHKGFKFYQIEIGSLIKFRNDPCYYSIRSFEGKNNLIAI